MNIYYFFSNICYWELYNFLLLKGIDEKDKKDVLSIEDKKYRDFKNISLYI